MAKLEWDKTGERRYELGVDHGVLYVAKDTDPYGSASVWNGLTQVSESPEGGEIEKKYADNIEYFGLQSLEEFKATIEAYTYPDEFVTEGCDGTDMLATGLYLGQQTRTQFGFSYRTKVGNDVDGQDAGYKIHLVYGCLASPSEKTRETINDSPDVITFSWEISTTPVEVTGHKPTAHLIVDSTKVTAAKMTALEAVLYGGDNTDARMPLPDEVKTLLT